MSNGNNRARRNMIFLFFKQDGECFYCKTEMFIRGTISKKYQKAHQGEMATFDHILVKSNGGGHSKDNGVCACHECNGIRGNMDQAHFISNFGKLRAQWFKRRKAKQARRDINEMNREANLSKRQLIKLKRSNNKSMNCYLVARFALQIGKPVEDLFSEFVYNNTYELTREL